MTIDDLQQATDEPDPPIVVWAGLALEENGIMLIGTFGQVDTGLDAWWSERNVKQQAANRRTNNGVSQ